MLAVASHIGPERPSRSLQVLAAGDMRNLLAVLAVPAVESLASVDIEAERCFE
jgi:hypothetical protein